MRVEGLSANKASHFSVIMEVELLPQFLFLMSFLNPDNSTLSSQIFQVAPPFIMVDIQKAAGDAEEYLKVPFFPSNLNFRHPSLGMPNFLFMQG